MDIDKLTSLNRPTTKIEKKLKDTKAMKDMKSSDKTEFDSFYSEDFLTNYFKLATPELKKEN